MNPSCPTFKDDPGCEVEQVLQLCPKSCGVGSVFSCSKNKHGCFSNGVYLGEGTLITSSKATDERGGGAIHAVMSRVKLSGAGITHSSAIELDPENGPPMGNGGAIALEIDAQLTVAASDNDVASFLTDNTAGQNGGAIYCEECFDITLADGTNITGNNAEAGDGGAMYLWNMEGDLKSSKSTFRKNKAHGDGGAVWMLSKEYKPWTSEADHFENNEATTGSGGAINALGVVVHFNVDTECKHNVAPQGGGGCIMWETLSKRFPTAAWLSPDTCDAESDEECTGYQPSIHNQAANVQQNNAAYGSNFASGVAAIRVVDDPDGRQSWSSEKDIVPFPIVELVDYYNSTVVGNNAIDLSITTRLVDTPTISTYSGKTTLSGKTEMLVVPLEGSATFNQLVTVGVPGSGPHHILFTSNFALKLNGVGGFRRTVTSGTMVKSVYIDPCHATTYLDDGTCKKCPLNSYLIKNVGPVEIACLCDANFYSEIPKINTLSCSKCPLLSTSNEGSTNIQDCQCAKTHIRSCSTGTDGSVACACVLCSAGQTKDAITGTCRPCKKGTCLWLL